MHKTQAVADDFRIKLAQVMRERSMGDSKNPDFENIIKNIKDLVQGFNYLSTQVKQKNETNQAAQALQNAGIEVTP